MLEALRQTPFNALFYVLNASQLATQDDRGLLEQVREELNSKPDLPVYFILNKIDLLDRKRPPRTVLTKKVIEQAE
jgi:GTPase Era involved in 16S rRNA processing